MKKGIATFTLDYGRCPPWLFERMVKLARIIVIAIIENFGPNEFLKRLSDPVWFQAFGSLLAFDWNASGLTTTVMAALKEAIFGLEKSLGIFICGGKGKTSKKTPDQILSFAEKINLSFEKAEKYIYLSRLTAKVDSALIQDGFQIYHHNFIFTRSGLWAVIQQGMNIKLEKARRYHWFSENIKNLTIEPHQGIQSEIVLPKVLNLVDKKSLNNRQGTLKLIKEKKDLFYEIKRIKRLTDGSQLTFLNLSTNDFHFHPILKENFFDKRLDKTINQLIEKPNQTFEDILMTQGVGPKTIRALTLVSEVIFGAPPSYEDPVRYTYTFGGKDGIPYPVNKNVYDQTIEIIEKAIKKSSLNFFEKEKLLRKNERLFFKNKV
ncbi:MAG: DUF763 domain-containing protein [Patescibacteria group bacterium]|nr:DUF763 domain-containing protein [Patescibacteria group bacterium]